MIRNVILLGVIVSYWFTHVASYHQFTHYQAEQKSLELLPSTTPTPTSPSDATGKQLHPSVNLLKTSGKNWKAWTIQDDILFEERQFSECKWRNYTATFNPKQSMPICLHPEKREVISSNIARSGNWMDCYAISSQWHASSKSSSKLHIEIGANLGACVVDLLLSSPEATIIAFEPHPVNLFRLTSTLKMAPLEFGSRVTVFPVALSAEGGGTAEILVEKTFSRGANFGASFLQASTNTATEQNQPQQPDTTKIDKDIPAEMIPVEKLDELVSGRVRLVKLDAQGFECNILDGMQLLLNMTERLTTELEQSSLVRNGCSRKGLLARLQSKFDVHQYRKGGRLTPLSLTRERDMNVVGISKSSD